MTFTSQLWELIKKDLLLVARRSWFSTVLRALVLPIAVTIVLSYVRILNAGHGSDGIGAPSQVLSLPDAFQAGKMVDYTNSADDVRQVITELQQIFEDGDKHVFIESDVAALYKRCPSTSRGASPCFGAVEFWSSPSHKARSQWKYTLWYDGAISGQVNVVSDRNPVEIYTIPLQHAIDAAIARTGNNSELPANIFQKPFTNISEAQKKQADQKNYEQLVVAFLAFAFFLPLCGITYHLTGYVARQREDGMLQLIDAMMPNRQWQCQVLRTLSVHLAFDIIYAPGWIVTGAIAGTVAFPNTNTGWLILCYVLTGLALTGYSIITSSLFRRVQVSAISSILAAVVFAIVAQFGEGILHHYASLPGVIATAVLFPPSAFVYFLTDTAIFENESRALDIDGTLSSYTYHWSISASIFLGCLAFQIIAYPILGALLERSLHGHSSRGRHVRTARDLNGSAIRLRSFTKEYNIAAKKRDRICAVENLSMDVHAGSITVLLGSNGSGKSTTLKSIAGLESVTRGSIEFDGTGGIGICTQGNVLYDDMTVQEHVAFFQRLKDPAMSRVASSQEVERLISGCDLDLKKHAAAKTLSGGQKRKLQLAMMLAGGSKVCCIDEASSGIDPLARRKVWDILLQERGHRTMLLTTHFLDESEVLSDHIAILSKGTLRAEGTVAELKNSLGGGYRVVLAGDEVNLRVQDIPTSIIRHEDYNNVVYEAVDTASLAQFVELLNRKRVLHYSVHGPTMEEIFLGLADEMRGIEPGAADELKDFQPRKLENSSQIRHPQHAHHVASRSATLDTGKGCGPLRQTWILFLKRFTILKHNYMPYFGALFVPLVLAGMVTRFLLPPFFNPNGLECTNPNSGGYAGYGGYGYNVYRADLQLNPFVYGPPSAVTEQQLRALLRESRESDSFLKISSAVSTLDELNLAFEPTASGKTNNYNAGGIFLGDTENIFAFESTAYFSPINAIGAQSVLNQALLNTSITVTAGEMDSPYIPNDFLQGIMAVFMVLGFSVYPGFFCLYPTAERLRNVRQMQYSNGILSSSLWIAYALFDLIFILLISILATVIWLVCIGSQLYGIGYLALVLLLYGVAATAYSYTISLFVRSQLSALAATSLLQVLLAMLFFVGCFVTIINADPATYHSQLNTIYYTMALVSPAVSLFRALLISLNVYSLACSGHARASYPGGIELYGGPILYLVVQSVLLVAFLMFWESGRSLEVFGIRTHPKAIDRSQAFEQADDVALVGAAEDTTHMAPSNDGLRVHNVSKTFKRNKAVDSVTFGVLPSEKFALLGPNGAGKSSTISLIRGENHPDTTKPRGEISISNDSLMHAPVAAKNHLGVCPQFDAVDRMTLSENLHFYARARGVPDRQHNIDELVNSLGLTDHVNKLVEKLSGGTKRKLSLAIALIANPSVLLLDEPSSGMDAAAKRALWQTLRHASAERCLLITTHSMEEADALCDRAGIMASKMLALDTIPRLREKHGGRIYIHLVHQQAPYTSEGETMRLSRWVQATFPAAQSEQKTFGGQIRFSIPVEGTEGETMGRLFGVIENAKVAIGIRDYSIGPTTLDQVFLNVVQRHGVAEEEAGAGKQRRRWLW